MPATRPSALRTPITSTSQTSETSACDRDRRWGAQGGAGRHDEAAREQARGRRAARRFPGRTWPGRTRSGRPTGAAATGTRGPACPGTRGARQADTGRRRAARNSTASRRRRSGCPRRSASRCRRAACAGRSSGRRSALPSHARCPTKRRNWLISPARMTNTPPRTTRVIAAIASARRRSSQWRIHAATASAATPIPSPIAPALEPEMISPSPPDTPATARMTGDGFQTGRSASPTRQIASAAPESDAKS